MTDPRAGLDSAKVAERVAAGLTNEVPPAPSRTIPEILRANVLTRFNALIGTLVVVVLVFGEIQDALFGGVIIANSIIGIIQEIRAKRTLDRLSLLAAPVAHVVRDGEVVELAVDRIVLGDVIALRSGDQIVADATVAEVDGMEVDESLLTGEADPVPKQPGDELLSGSFVCTGTARAQVTKVGAEAYAARLAEEARRFTLANSELRASIDRIVTWVGWALIPAAIGLVWSQLRENEGFADAAVAAVAGMVGMIPEGLVLLTSVAFAVGVVRLAGRRTLVQELPAVETLARVDVVCLDKTGTITEGSMAVEQVVLVDPAWSEGELELALAAIAHADPDPNATQRALAERFESAPGDWHRSGSVPFSSARKWSATAFEGHGWFVLGAPEMVVHGAAYDRIAEQVEHSASDGLRVLVLARSGVDLDGDGLPDTLEPAALVMLADKLRPDAAETLRFFAEQGVTLKVISGDNPVTVSSVAGRAGLAGAGDYLDARELPEDTEALADVLDTTTVFGRVNPHQKRAMVAALQSRGHVVAMTGDGVNDVLALKDADCGIAMASGSEATRAVAQIVLLDSSFAGLPHVVDEGRRVINNLQRVAALFLTKTTYSVTFAFATGLVGMPFLFLPRHLTLVSTLCIGIPSFFLALAPNTERVRGNFLRRVGRDSVPFGLITAAATLTVYLVALYGRDLPLPQSRTAAVLTLAGCSLVVLLRNARPLRGWKLGLVSACGAAVTAAFTTPPGRDFFALTIPPVDVVGLAAACIAAAAVLMVVAHRVFVDHDHVLESAPPTDVHT